MDEKNDLKSDVPQPLQATKQDGPPPPTYDRSVGPQIALNADFMSNSPISLKVKGHSFSTDLDIIGPDGQIIFKVIGSAFSASHRTLLVDAKSDSQLFEISKKVWSVSWRYSADVPGGNGEKLFETETTPKFFSGGTTVMNFRNAMTGQQDTIELKLNSFSTVNDVLYRGQKIGEIEHEPFSFSPRYSIELGVPGVDLLLVTVMVTVMHDRRRHRKQS